MKTGSGFNGKPRSKRVTFKITMKGKVHNKSMTFTVTEIVAVDKDDAIAQAKTEAVIQGMRSPRIQRVEKTV
jgi:hypothetical protein